MKTLIPLLRSQSGFPSSDAPENTFPCRLEKNAPDKTRRATTRAEGADKIATAGTASSYSIAQGTAARSDLAGSTREFRRPRSSLGDGTPADSRTPRSRDERKFRVR